MKKQLLFLLVLCLSTVLNAQEKYTATQFPNDWAGYFAGKMYIANPGQGLVDSLDVSLDMQLAEDEQMLSYTMTYDNETYGLMVKDYQYVLSDTLPKNNFWMDEKNGIMIQEALIGNSIYSHFEVAGSTITLCMRLGDDYIDFDLVSYREDMGHKSKSIAETEGDQEFEVHSIPAVVSQFARMYKADKPE